MTPTTVSRRTPSAVWLVLASIASLQWGSAFAKSLFDRLDPTAMVWLRLLTAGLVLGLVVRPRLRGRSSGDWLTVVAYAASLGLMNWAFYQAIARIHLGLVVTLEFVGPLTLAVVLSLRKRDLLWIALAALGVALLGFRGGHLDPWGVVFALTAGALWASYIIFSGRTGQRWERLDGIATASVLLSVAFAPAAIVTGGSALLDPVVLGLGFAVGLLSSVIPYSLELVALRTMPPAVFGILMSLEPAAAALSGMLVLHEFLSPVQWLAMACVVVASLGITRSEEAPAEPLPG